jgi:hypothetical protein
VGPDPHVLLPNIPSIRDNQSGDVLVPPCRQTSQTRSVRFQRPLFSYSLAILTVHCRGCSWYDVPATQCAARGRCALQSRSSSIWLRFCANSSPTEIIPVPSGSSAAPCFRRTSKRKKKKQKSGGARGGTDRAPCRLGRWKPDASSQSTGHVDAPRNSCCRAAPKR